MANWQYMTVGAALVAEINEGAGVPHIPGNVSKDMKAVGFPVGSGTQKMSSYLEKLWPGAWRNKKYSTLPKTKAVLSQLAYGYYGQYNSNKNINGNTCADMGWTQEIVSSSGTATEWYVGCIIYSIRRNSHRGGYPDDYLAKATITITFTDNSTQVIELRGPQRRVNDGGYLFPAECQPYKTRGTGERGQGLPVTVWKTGRTSKPIKKIRVVSTIPNWGYQYHDIGDCGWIKTEIINNKENTFANCFGTYQLEKKIPFDLKDGTPVDKCESPVMIINGVARNI